MDERTETKGVSLKPIVLTSAPGPLRPNLEAALVYKVECLNRVSSVDDTRDVNLVRALTDHLNVDAALSESGEHAPCDTHEVPHLLPHKRQDGHIALDRGL